MSLKNTLSTNILSLEDKCNINSELEVSVYSGNITRDKSIAILEFLFNRVNEKKYKLEQSISLDVNANVDDNCTLRASIYQLDNINKILKQYGKRNNYEIFNELINLMRVNDNIKIMVKKRIEVITLQDYNLRIRLSDETLQNSDDISFRSNLDNNKINFRFKDRKSFIVFDNTDARISIDLTSVKSGKSISNVFNNQNIYELEVELTFKSKPKDIKKYIDIIESELIDLVQIFQQSKQIISKADNDQIIQSMKTLLHIDQPIKDLPFMRGASTELVDITDHIPNRYSVSDKADGEHIFLYILDGNVNIIRNNLEVIKCDDVMINEKIINEYNNSILDCELVTYNKVKKLILCFDILYYKNINVMTEKTLSKRLSYMYELTNKLFLDDIPHKYDGEYDINKLLKFYETDMIRCMNSFTKNINSKYNSIVHSKYFIFLMGGHPSEVYAYTDLMWNIYINNKIDSPYHLDGIIFTGIEQPYILHTMKVPVIYKIYKWKPSDKNSIDFYIEFERDSQTKEILDVYDASKTNTITEYKHNEEDLNYYETDKKIYKIANLYVGKRMPNNKETYVLFQKDAGTYIANLYIQDGHVRDIEGNIIQDKTVVEFSYNNNPLIDPQFRWVPLRTRDDKTEQVIKNQRQYGNAEVIAEKIWFSIINPIIETDIKLLANPKTFHEHIKTLKAKITTELITQVRMEDKYYQIRSNIAKPFREYQNFVKSCLIYVYCKQSEVLEFACGRGGDIMKFFHAQVKNYVGFDIDPNGISAGSDGCISRYNTMRKRNKGYFPKMTFLVSDACTPLDYESQFQVFGPVIDEYRNAMIENFGADSKSKHKQFDVINCQFMIHYAFKNSDTFKNFCNNVTKMLKNDGIILITTFDGALLNKTFKDGQITGEYVTETGDKEVAYNIRKLYDEKDINKFGLNIDVLMKWISNEYYTEFLVSKEFLIKEFKKHNLELVETELFGTLYELNKEFLTSSTLHESSETANWFRKVKEYYNDDININICTRNYSKLTRYYIFRKVK